MPVLVLLLIFLGLVAPSRAFSAKPVFSAWPIVLASPRRPLALARGPFEGPAGSVRGSLEAPAGFVRGSLEAPAGFVRGSLEAPAGFVRGSREGPVGFARGSFGWPVAPARVVRAFDPPAAPWLAGHRGVDLAASPGAVVRAAGAGRVVYAAELAGRGVVSVQHPDGLRTTYEPVTPSVAAGDQVGSGNPLGRLEPGHPGCPATDCLHWGLRRGDLYLDPLALLGLGRVRLLPLQEAPPRLFTSGQLSGSGQLSALG
jgi:murein DD-endopeptidase MepM/ murein hydrolase activator NlpD